MIVDTEKLFHAVNRNLAAVQKDLDEGMFPQVREDLREERTYLRSVKDALAVVELYAVNQVLQPESRGGSRDE